MNSVIKKWINHFYPDKNSCVNKCNIAVRSIVAKFPELNIQVGYANGIYHCWCCDAQGNIVDPTAKQFNDDKIKYQLIANRFLKKDEIEMSTGAIFLKPVSY